LIVAYSSPLKLCHYGTKHIIIIIIIAAYRTTNYLPPLGPMYYFNIYAMSSMKHYYRKY